MLLISLQALIAQLAAHPVPVTGSGICRDHTVHTVRLLSPSVHLRDNYLFMLFPSGGEQAPLACLMNVCIHPQKRSNILKRYACLLASFGCSERKIFVFSSPAHFARFSFFIVALSGYAACQTCVFRTECTYGAPTLCPVLC